MDGLYERFQLFMGGGMAGGIGVTAVYPIDVVKTYLPVSFSTNGGGESS